MAKVLILVGSGTENSRSLNLSHEIEKSLNKQGVNTEMIDLRLLALPQYDATIENTDTYDDKTRRFLDKSKRADGFIWVTPVYHNSYSSILKTALDWQHFKLTNKVVGLASHAGRSPQPLDQLMLVARAQHAVPIPIRVATNNEDFDDNKQLVNQEIFGRIEDFSTKFVDFLNRFAK